MALTDAEYRRLPKAIRAIVDHDRKTADLKRAPVVSFAEFKERRKDRGFLTVNAGKIYSKTIGEGENGPTAKS